MKEYWIGAPANKTLEVLTLKKDRYELHGCVEEKGKLTSALLAGLEFGLWLSSSGVLSAATARVI